MCSWLSLDVYELRLRSAPSRCLITWQLRNCNLRFLEKRLWNHLSCTYAIIVNRPLWPEKKSFALGRSWLLFLELLGSYDFCASNDQSSVEEREKSLVRGLGVFDSPPTSVTVVKIRGNASLCQSSVAVSIQKLNCDV
ncbi:unnamed protein product [Orchesella dallaii]|uniref:Uncharacterized protein n=1 Tax=Orchesella dallaii TaxID=48710 RepID=A0ABP1RCM8_9HEXA